MISALLTRYWTHIIKWVAVAGGILLVLLRVRSGGRRAEMIERLEARDAAKTQTIQQDKMVRSGAIDIDRMRTRLSERLRDKHRS